MKKMLAGLLVVATAALFGCGGSSTPAQTTVSGTASQGAPVAEGAVVTLKDATGAIVTSTVKANGVYSVVVDGKTPPYVLNAGGFYTFASAAGTTNINPLTHLSMQLALGTSSISNSTVIPAGFQAQFAATATELKTKIDALYPSTVPATQRDFLGGTITIAAGVDKVFDALVIAAPDSSGNFSVTMGGQQILSGTKLAGVQSIVQNNGAITAASASITSNSSTSFTVGTAGSFTVTGTGAFSMAGALPTGVSFNAATGLLSGTPASGSNASYPLTFTATNNGFSWSQPFTLTVNSAAVVPPSLIGSYVGTVVITTGGGAAFGPGSTVGTFTFAVNDTGHLGGTLIDLTDAGAQWPLNGIVNLATGATTASSTTGGGDVIHLTGTPTSGTWTAPGASGTSTGTYTATKQ
jgi:hypothetical protein